MLPCKYEYENGMQCTMPAEVVLIDGQEEHICVYHLREYRVCAKCRQGPFGLDEEGLCASCAGLDGLLKIGGEVR